jgi:DNA-binding FrmR family transcriptional regulator
LPAKIYLSNVVEALRQSLNGNNEKPDALIAKFSGQKVTEEQFIAFCLELPELLVDGKIPLYSHDELKAAFKSLAASEIQENGRTSETSEVSKQCLLNQFQTRYTCSASVVMTDKLAVRGCKTIRKLQVGEVLDVLEDAVKDERSGLLRLKARTEDGVEGYVTLTGNVTGMKFLEPFLPHTALLQRVETTLQQMTEALKDCAKELDTKMQATSSSRHSTPLADAKAEISKLRPRIAAVQSTLTGLRKNLTSARQTISETEDSEKRRREEALDRGVASSLTESAQKEVSEVFTQLDKVLPIAEKFAELRSSTSEESADNVSIEGLLESEKDLSAIVEALSGLKIKISNWQGQCTSYSGPFGEAWKALSKLEGQVKENDERCQKIFGNIQSIHKQLAIAARSSLVSALRALIHSKEEDSPASAEALFEKLSNGNPTISLEDLKNLIGSKFKAGELELALERSAISQFGWTKFGFLAAVQDYMKCVKEVAVTEEFDVKIGKQVKKLALGDVVEVLDATKLDEATNLPRVRCRTLVDLQEGWVSLKTTQGSNLLERCAKPFYTLHDDIPMHESLESSSSEVGRLHPGQVIEVLEGPKREAPTECMRVRGACSKDGKTGWLTLKEGDASDCLEVVKVLVCRSNTVLTSEFDVGAGKTVRKLELGELMEALDEPQVDEQRSLTRTKVKLRKDDKEGWVTFIGNQGVNYVAESDSHHLCKRRVALETGFKSGSSVLRYVEEGEILEVLEGPKSEKKDGQQRLRGRTHRPPQEGWVTFNRSLTLWSPKYRCLRSSDITEKLDVTSAVVRRLTPSELVEALDLPQVDESTGQVRVQVRVEKDNKLGFVTVRSLEGTVFLEALAPSDRERIGRGSHPNH